MTRRIDYQPVQAPVNPQAAAARAAMQEYAAMIRGEQKPIEPCHDSPLSEVEQAEDEARYINACFDQWPTMRRYADTARIETLTIYNPHTHQWEHGPCVTVTIKGSNDE